MVVNVKFEEEKYQRNNVKFEEKKSMLCRSPRFIHCSLGFTRNFTLTRIPMIIHNRTLLAQSVDEFYL